MADIEYKGLADAVEFSVEDFERHGITIKNPLVFNQTDKKVVTVNKEVFEFLTKEHNAGQDFGPPKAEEEDPPAEGKAKPDA